MTDKEINWQPLSMIPVYAEMISKILDSSKLQLGMIQIKDHPLLNDDLISHILESQEEQQELIPACLKQCTKWGKEELSEKQSNWISEIKKNVSSLSLISKEIMSIVKSKGKNKIDSVL